MWRISFLLLLAAAVPARCSDTSETQFVAHRDIAYLQVADVDPKLLSLDLYVPDPAPAAPLPVVIYVHGGGWSIGDKGYQMQYKPSWFTDAGYCFINMNYRLSPRGEQVDPSRIMYPVHEQDVAAGVAWVRNHVAEYGGNPKRIVLMGHSAGAHLVNLISTDESFLAAYGMDLSEIGGTIVLDTGGYDIAGIMARMPLPIYTTAFGTDPAVWAQASPSNHVAPGKGIPPMLLVTRGTAWRKAECRSFAEKLNEAGGLGTVLDAGNYSHADVNVRIGQPGEQVVTPAVMAFLQQNLR